MKYNEKIKDIFKVKNVDAVIQCIAQDAGMGAGIAVMFDKRYPGMKMALREMDLQYPTVEVWDKKETRPDVINMITKPVSYRPPTFDDFDETMHQVRQIVIANQYKTLAMPMIGAGLDKLNWKTQVLPSIHHHLDDLEIELTVYFTPENCQNMQ